MHADMTDESLMLAYRDGDVKAFATLYERHRGSLHRLIQRQCGSAALAEELFQDVWMNVIRASARYEVSAKFTTWIYRIAHNRVIDHYREHARVELESFGEDIPSEVETLADMVHRQP